MATTHQSSAAGQAPPPHSLEAEQAVLGSVLLDPHALAIIEGTLSPESFYHQRHIEIYNAMVALVDRGQPVDLMTLEDELERREVLETAGGRGYLAALPTMVISPQNVGFHADIVMRKARLRALITASRETLEEALQEKDDVDLIVDAAEQRLFNISRESSGRDFRPMSEIIEGTLDEIEKAKEQGGQLPGVSTGYADLDKLLMGLHGSDLLVLAARPAMGKTAFALNLALNVALKAQRGVGIFSLEMGSAQLSARMLSILSGVPTTVMRSGKVTDAEQARIDKEARNIDLAPLFVEDTPGQSISEIRSKARRLKMKYPDLGLLIIDYLQLMTGSRRVESRQQEISEITRSLKELARELELPLIALSQLSRKVEERRGKDRRPILSDLRESGAIEQDADIVMFLHRESYYEEEREAEFQDTAPSETEVLIAKHRNGPTGNVPLLFFRKCTKFVNRLDG